MGIWGDSGTVGETVGTFGVGRVAGVSTLSSGAPPRKKKAKSFKESRAPLRELAGLRDGRLLN